MSYFRNPVHETSRKQWAARILGVVAISLVAFFFSGCTTVGRHTVSGTLTTTAHDTPETDVFDLSPEAAKLKVKLAKIRADVEKTKAKAAAKAEAAKALAANPCLSWVMAPSHCYDGGRYIATSGAYGTTR